MTAVRFRSPWWRLSRAMCRSPPFPQCRRACTTPSTANSSQTSPCNRVKPSAFGCSTRARIGRYGCTWKGIHSSRSEPMGRPTPPRARASTFSWRRPTGPSSSSKRASPGATGSTPKPTTRDTPVAPALICRWPPWWCAANRPTHRWRRPWWSRHGCRTCRCRGAGFWCSPAISAGGPVWESSSSSTVRR